MIGLQGLLLGLVYTINEIKERKGMSNVKVITHTSKEFLTLELSCREHNITFHKAHLDEVIQALTTYRDALPKPCVHAELIKQYAEDCQKYEKPWELWEHRWSGEVQWLTIIGHPSWAFNYQYRRKTGAPS